MFLHVFLYVNLYTLFTWMSVVVVVSVLYFVNPLWSFKEKRGESWSVVEVPIVVILKIVFSNQNGQELQKYLS